MSTFVVSARKYRPSRFEDVVGQEHVSVTLKNALQNDHLAHAFLFCGPRGVGKTTCARILAKVLNCKNVTADFEPCNTCDACKSFNDNASFNITELDAASNNSVEHIRTLIEQVRFQPQQGKYKVFIIDEVHMLSQQAFNAFLKTLEEPPSYAIFILATTEKHKIIPTILSRCQIFDFKRIQVPQIVSHLQSICQEENIAAEPEALHVIAEKADGALRDALSIFDRMVSFSNNKITYEDVIANLNVLDYDYFFKIVDALLSEDISSILLTYDEIMRKGFDGEVFVNGLSEHLRNILVCKDQNTISLLEVSPGLQEKYLQQAALAPSGFLISALDQANECDIHYKTARNKRLHVEMALIKMAYINRAVQVHQIAPPSTQEKKTSVLTEPERKSTPPTIQEEIQTPKAKANLSSPISLKTTLGTKKMDLAAIAEAIEIETEASEVVISELNLENLQKAWNRYIDQIDRDTLKNILQQTEIRLEEKNIVAIVSSSLSESAIRQENGLMDFLRTTLQRQDITLTLEVDKSKAPPPPKKKEVLTPKQIYLQMNEMNPMVQEMQKRFNLKPE